MDIKTILFWLAVVIVAWLGIRNLITIITGLSKRQRLCAATGLLFWGACLSAILDHSWWPLIIGAVLAYFFRQIIIRQPIIQSVEKVDKLENEMLLAVRSENIGRLKSVIEQGANINFQDSKVFGVTALHDASRIGNVEIVRYLLQNGADVHSKSYKGFTALHAAAGSGKNAVVKILIEEGADVNEKAKDNVTALHWAAMEGNLETVKLLLNNGAEADSRTSKSGLTPKDFALREGHQNVVDLLSTY